MSHSGDAPPSGARRRTVVVAITLLAVVHATSMADPADQAFWLKFGKSARLCPGARDAVPEKLEGATWGVLASGQLSCRDAGNQYTLTVNYLNVAIDPRDHAMLTQPVVRFDWLGLALFRPASSGHDVDWLFDQSHPVRGELRRDASGRIVFGDLSFIVPKHQGDMATNMLLYLTFGGPLVAIDAH